MSCRWKMQLTHRGWHMLRSNSETVSSLKDTNATSKPQLGKVDFIHCRESDSHLTQGSTPLRYQGKPPHREAPWHAYKHGSPQSWICYQLLLDFDEDIPGYQRNCFKHLIPVICDKSWQMSWKTSFYVIGNSHKTKFSTLYVNTCHKVLVWDA